MGTHAGKQAGTHICRHAGRGTHVGMQACACMPGHTYKHAHRHTSMGMHAGTHVGMHAGIGTHVGTQAWTCR